ncbi:hypothetical protein V6Z90_000943 [Aspergillus fumigatus]
MFCLGSIDVCFKRHSSWNLIAVGPPLHHFPVSAYVLLFSSGCSEPEPPNKSFTESFIQSLIYQVSCSALRASIWAGREIIVSTPLNKDTGGNNW